MREQPREGLHPVDPETQAAQKDLAVGIQMLTTDWDLLVADFAYCAGQIAGDTDAPARIQGMMEFAVNYHTYGLKVSEDAIERVSGVPVEMEIPERPEREVAGETTIFRTERPPQMRQGLIVSIVGAEVPPDREQDRHLQAIALMENRLGQEVFVPVSLYPNGRTVARPEIYDPEFQDKYHTPKRMIEALFPPINRLPGRDGATRSPEKRGGFGGGERGPQSFG